MFKDIRRKFKKFKYRKIESEVIDVSDLLIRVDIDDLYPPFAELLIKLLQNCRKRGYDYFLISGFRSHIEQKRLYAIGRTTGIKGKIVTKARPGYSSHNYKVAGDCCHDRRKDRAGLQPGWSLSEYKILQEEAEKLHLESAMSWKTFKEGPHIQLPLKLHMFTFKDMKLLHSKSNGTSRLIKVFNKHDWGVPLAECKFCQKHNPKVKL